MKIVVLTGSPNKNGSSNLLAEQFIWGATQAGHSVQAIDVAHANIHPCTGCIHCVYEGPCVQKDDVNEICQKAHEVCTSAVAWNSDTWTYGMLESHYHTLVRYLNLKDQGVVLRKVCGTSSMTQHSEYPQMTYDLGKKMIK